MHLCFKHKILSVRTDRTMDSRTVQNVFTLIESGKYASVKTFHHCLTCIHQILTNFQSRFTDTLSSKFSI